MIAKHKRKEMVCKVYEYINNNTEGLPSLKECCLLMGWDLDEVQRAANEDETLKKAIKTLQLQREVNLEKGGVYLGYNKVFTAYLLSEDIRESVAETAKDRLCELDRRLESEAFAAMHGGQGDGGN
ncbi:MAG: hypothetical protein FWC95_05015 [Defluviitaleaceae bacterium]|nr:hypothetical protein [Defluviitaleaceae bacterium]